MEEESPEQRYEAFCQLSGEDKEAMLVFVSAMSFKAPYHQKDLATQVRAKVSIDSAQYWRPDTDSFLKRIDKDALIEIARPVMSQTWLQSAQSLKKGDLVKQLDLAKWSVSLNKLNTRFAPDEPTHYVSGEWIILLHW
ncbi:hypothetical protein [Vibrio jasicida]|uniref:hypothetical protein n=1 Tax=Vibrio jasicida TaxID=766224 RepID=UPI0005EFF021|nr:hypothetical protein [Vibrio jasicida]